jgi:hypothetical protein
MVSHIGISRRTLQGICHPSDFHAQAPPRTLHRDWTGVAYFMGTVRKSTQKRKWLLGQVNLWQKAPRPPLRPPRRG